MKEKSKPIIIFLLFISSFICVFTGNEKGLIFPIIFIELGLIDTLIDGKITNKDLLFLIILILIQFPILSLLKFKKFVNKIIIPSIFIVGYLSLNFYDLNFKDGEKAIVYSIPFLIIWIMLLIKKNKS